MKTIGYLMVVSAGFLSVRTLGPTGVGIVVLTIVGTWCILSETSRNISIEDTNEDSSNGLDDFRRALGPTI